MPGYRGKILRTAFATRKGHETKGKRTAVKKPTKIKTVIPTVRSDKSPSVPQSAEMSEKRWDHAPGPWKGSTFCLVTLRSICLRGELGAELLRKRITLGRKLAEGGQGGTEDTGWISSVGKKTVGDEDGAP